ncbi:flagellar hook capping FlgD N-terminal domain-containing protein [Halanaerobacter jeridensis]|uniref:Flagellar basal-body rod modification protein FlgD n=1 Tax=Halanaerobacter jeridensis TaxID=706427 RepID=A0A938XN40_9FIRM|nr:flagellar hook capping FlgD N-terminal domain-containing protein [Halanaerobacter jeridensis]MBM7555343.1 flagellar basal-body rod modification protein FlgD [Halanaerobacter jeridensis]
MMSLQQIYQSSQGQIQQTAQTSDSQENTDVATNALNNNMGKDQFLELLTTQLKNQNPLEPMDNKQFISQMAQFSSLEQMNNLNSTMGNFVKFQKISQAGSLVGKKVEVLNSSTGQTITGKIEKANVTGDSTTITVNGSKYPLANIQQIIAGE